MLVAVNHFNTMRPLAALHIPCDSAFYKRSESWEIYRGYVTASESDADPGLSLCLFVFFIIIIIINIVITVVRLCVCQCMCVCLLGFSFGYHFPIAVINIIQPSIFHCCLSCSQTTGGVGAHCVTAVTPLRSEISAVRKYEIYTFIEL